MKPKYTQICEFLRRCFFNPNKPGPLSIIADIGNPNYYEMRAIEFIKEAPECYIKEQTIAAQTKLAMQEYDDKIIKAIKLLVLARETRYQGIKDILSESENHIKETTS